MSALNIINRLINAGMTVNGALGMWGNIMAESGGIPNRVQMGMTPYDDATYTRYADEGRVNFIYDQVGFGYIQLTFWSRKAGLMERAKARGVSVGDSDLQIDYLIEEIKGYSKVWKAVTDPNTSIYDATAIICADFERPAHNNIDKRYGYAVDAYNQYKDQLDGKVEPVSNSAPTPTKPATPSIIVLRRGSNGFIVRAMQILLAGRGYSVGWLGADGEFGKSTEEAVIRFQTANGLEADGICGQQTWNALLSK